MALNQAQLVNPPESGRTGGVKSSSTINIAADGTVSLPNSGVTPASYQNANITVDAQGRVTSASEGSGGVPAGAVMLFVMAAAPTGWTQDLGGQYNDVAIRLVTSGGGGTGGTINFSSFFNASSTYSGNINITSGSVGGSSLSVGQLAAHDHSYLQQTLFTAGYVVPGNDGVNAIRNSAQTGSTGNNEAHTHSLAGATATGNFSSNFNVRYVNMIVCSKN